MLGVEGSCEDQKDKRGLGNTMVISRGDLSDAEMCSRSEGLYSGILDGLEEEERALRGLVRLKGDYRLTRGLWERMKASEGIVTGAMGF